VQFKIDFFEGWLPQQSPRDQEIILDLAKGHTTGEVAKKHGVSDGAIEVRANNFQLERKSS